MIDDLLLECRSNGLCYLWRDLTNKLRSAIVEEGTVSLSKDCFSGCEKLERVKLPESLKIIPYGAFRGCTSLGSIDLPAGVKVIEAWAFEGCSSLEEIVIPPGVSEISVRSFSDCTALRRVIFLGSPREISFPFSGCTSLEELNIPGSVKKLGLSKLPSMRRITIPEGVEEVIFEYCTALEELELPSTARTVGMFCCSSLRSLRLPKTVERLNDRAFVGCESLTDLYIENPNITFGDNVFDGLDQTVRVYFAGTREDWERATATTESYEGGATLNDFHYYGSYADVMCPPERVVHYKLGNAKLDLIPNWQGD